MPRRIESSRPLSNVAAAICVIQGVDDAILDGFLWFVLAIGEHLIELVRDLLEIVRECSWPDARADKERLARLRSWNERLKRSLDGQAAVRSRV
ncbi:MAG: hypothetical protein WB579_01935 [Bryobacteraceae bacterium]